MEEVDAEVVVLGLFSLERRLVPFGGLGVVLSILGQVILLATSLEWFHLNINTLITT